MNTQLEVKNKKHALNKDTELIRTLMWRKARSDLGKWWDKAYANLRSQIPLKYHEFHIMGRAVF